jgi:hypothetical protein
MRVPRIHPDVNDARGLAELERGFWVFDRSGAQLIYLPQLYRGLDTPDGMVRFRLVRGPGAPYLLVPAANYSWH